MSGDYGPSSLWIYNNATRVTQRASKDLAGFKSSAINYKLALWDPAVNGVRYLKSLIYNLAALLTEEDWMALRRTQHRDVGEPITVRYHGETICMDYLQAVLELKFISGQIDLDGLSILEIGAGYGRTAHTLMSNHNVSMYYIIDLENGLQLAVRYLETVLDDEQFEKIRFVPAAEVGDLPRPMRVDLCINIDSFAEMDPTVVRSYLAIVADSCHYFYTKNPVGKYLDMSLDGHSQGDDAVAFALQAGLLRDIIDIHDSDAVEGQVDKFIDAYRPDGDWKCVAHSNAIPWSFYWQALYYNSKVAETT
jgi:putative sugar O-methyltransferase